jgi:glycosyltransferase involved in cell wall biosynthesis
MRILILVDFYLPGTSAAAQLVHDLAVELRRRDHAVTVGTVDEGVSGGMQLSLEDGIRVARFRSGRLKRAPLWRRAVNEVLLSRTVWRRGRRFFNEHPCDLIIFYSPTIFWAGLVARLKSIWDCPAYLILRDIFPQWPVDLGMMRRGGLPYRFFRRQELRQYDVADVVGVQSPANLDYFREPELAGRCRLEVLHNWASPVTQSPQQYGYREALGLQDRVIFVYGGNIGVAQDMDNVVRLASALRDLDELFFLLVGDGSEVDRLRARIAAEGLMNMAIRPAMPQVEYHALLAECDVGLISLSARLRTQNVPGKLLGYLAASLPVLASLNPGNDLEIILHRAGAGFCVRNGDDDALRTTALRLAGDAALRRDMGSRARRLLMDTFSVEAAADRILSHFGDTAEGDIMCFTSSDSTEQ